MGQKNNNYKQETRLLQGLIFFSNTASISHLISFLPDLMVLLLTVRVSTKLNTNY